jgi:hypothetical protein
MRIVGSQCSSRLDRAIAISTTSSHTRRSLGASSMVVRQLALVNGAFASAVSSNRTFFLLTFAVSICFSRWRTQFPTAQSSTANTILPFFVSLSASHRTASLDS